MTERIVLQHLHELRDGRIADFSPSDGTTFLSPSDHTATDCAVWIPTSASIASRRPPARSKGHSRGFVVYHASNRALVFESMLERDLACILMANRRVAFIHDQPPAVPYVDGAGKQRRHTFDYLVHTTSGERIAFAVKPQARVARSGIEATLDAIRGQANGFAHRILLRTERQITKDRAYNARTILRARRARNHSDVETVAAGISTLNGNVRLCDLVTLSGLGARGWNSLICLIDDGVLELAKGTCIGDRSLVRLAPRPTEQRE